MSGSPPPKDNSVELANIEAQRAREARENEARTKAEERSRFESNLGNSYNSAIDDARGYFLSRGLNPDDYIGVIQRAATNARNKVPDLASAPGTYFDNLGATAYGSERDAQRASLMRAINSFAGDGFSTRRIASDSDDATLEAILQEQRATADEYVRNLLDRGVITATGYDAAAKNLDNQSFGARARLQEVGNAELERGRGEANRLANEGRTRASNFELGETFDPYAVSSDIDNSIAAFFQNLGGSLRAAVPTGLFSTSGLAGVAGAGQGAQNTKFDPMALAGVFGDVANDDEENERQLLSAF